MGSGAELRAGAALAVLRLVHEQPGIARAEVARRLGLSSGSASEIVSRLRARRLVVEVAPPEPGRRGRPSGLLVAHPQGPVVCAADVTHAGWRVAAIELGGGIVETRAGRHAREPGAVLAAVARALDGLRCTMEGRVAAAGVSIAGTVAGERLLQAATLRWRDLDLRRAVPPTLAGVPFVAGNDATLAGLAEARRGVACDVPVVLHLAVEVGIGGVLLVDGQPLVGALGEAGEFGHMPFGDPALRCPCGAAGCWDLEVDGRALARLLGRRQPADPRSFAETAIAAAREGSVAEAAAVGAVARALGRGTGAIVNALDPALVVYGGLAADLLEAVPTALHRGYEEGLMRHRRRQPPPLARGSVAHASLVGAAEAAFDEILDARLLDGR